MEEMVKKKKKKAKRTKSVASALSWSSGKRPDTSKGYAPTTQQRLPVPALLATSGRRSCRKATRKALEGQKSCIYASRGRRLCSSGPKGRDRGYEKTQALNQGTHRSIKRISS